MLKKHISIWSAQVHTSHPAVVPYTEGISWKTLSPLGEEHLEAFQILIESVLSPIVLSIPYPGLRYSLDADSSAYQVGCALFQAAKYLERKQLGFHSCTLNKAEQNYSLPEREFLAFVHGVTICRSYLFGEEFKLRTDHSCLR